MTQEFQSITNREEAERYAVEESLRKEYGSALPVNDVSFTIRRGEMFGFLGPNGAGKTTTH